MNPKPFLPMWDVAAQQHRRGGISASYSQVRSTGLPDAAGTLFDQMMQTLRERPQDQSHLSELDALQPQRLAQAVRARLNGMPDFGDPGLDPEELRKRLAILTGVRAKNAARASREAVDHAVAAVDEHVDQLRTALDQALATGPDRARQAVDQVRQVLQAAAFPPPDPQPLAQLGRLLKAREQIQARRTSLTPASLEFVLAQLTNEARAAYEQALDALAAELAADVFRRAARKLDAFLDGLAARGTEFTRIVAAVEVELEEFQKATAREQHVSRASVVLPLEGPDEKQVLAGLLGRAGCGDLGELAARLLDRYEARLRELAPLACPWLDAAAAPLADLVGAIEVGHLAGAFVELVEESMGAGQTLYEVVAQFGVEKCAAFLYHRAEPTCHLSGRDIEQFNVCTTVLAIVRMPVPVGPRDHEIRAALTDAFRRLGHCTFTEGPKSDRTLTVVRLQVGWPIGIEESNRALLERYLRSGEHGHRPHLIGVLPDSDLGLVSQRCQDLNPHNYRRP